MLTCAAQPFENFRNAICGACFSIVFIVAAFPLLWWNEGVAVQTARSLDEGMSLVKSVDYGRVDPANEGQLVHVSAPVSEAPLLVDGELGVAVRGLQLQRTVEMYQWHESSRSHETTDAMGTKRRVTEYSYSERWSPKLERTPHAERGYENPRSFPFSAGTAVADRARVGAFELGPREIGSLQPGEQVPLSESALDRMREVVESRANAVGTTEPVRYLDAPLASGARRLPQRRGKRGSTAVAQYRDRDLRVTRGALHTGSLAAPQIGDVRITYQVASPSSVSVVARQRGSRFVPFQTQSGDRLHLVEAGYQDAAAMFAAAQFANTLRTWALRGAGFFLLFIGVIMLLSPLSAALRILPLVGSFVAGLADLGICVAALGVSVPLALTTIAAAWVYYRPLLATVLLGAALIPVLGLHKRWQELGTR